MKYLVIRDAYRRKSLYKYRTVYNLSRVLRDGLLISSVLYDRTEIALAVKKIMSMRYSSITRLRNRCLYSGRSRAVFRRFKVSRIRLRELSGKSYIYGFKKSSW